MSSPMRTYLVLLGEFHSSSVTVVDINVQIQVKLWNVALFTLCIRVQQTCASLALKVNAIRENVGGWLRAVETSQNYFKQF